MDEDEDQEMELTEQGAVSEETKGDLVGFWPDGGIGFTFQ